MTVMFVTVAEANFSSRAFPTGTEYASWETDEVKMERFLTLNTRGQLKNNLQILKKTNRAKVSEAKQIENN